MVSLERHEKFDGVYWIESEDQRSLATKNLDKGFQVYGEKLVKVAGEEYRLWNPYRSKLAAAMLKDIDEVGIKEGSRVLYLGVASGTTASHVSDIIGVHGMLYGVDVAPRPMLQFESNIAKRRANVAPILADARFPRTYCDMVGEVDIVYCDIAQPEQASLFSDNAELMLKDDGIGLIAVKARSIDSVAEPAVVFNREIEILKRRGFEILNTTELEPYERDHIMVVCRFRRP